MNAELHTLTGAYALNALAAEERAEFEDHLAQCAACRKEVAELRDTAARLGAAVGARPPEHLRPQVLAAARRVRQLPPRTASEVPVDGHFVDEVPSGPDPGGRSRNWPLWLTSAAAAAAVVMAVVLGVQVSRMDDQARDAQRQLEEVSTRQEALVDVLAAPDAKVRSARGAFTATVVVSERLDRMVFLPRRVPEPRAGEAYQLWLIGPGGARSAGVLAQPARPLVADALGDADRVGVTVEPAGGSPEPTSDPVLLITV